MFVIFQTRSRYRTLTLALAAVVTTALTVAVAIAMLIAGAVVVAALFLARAVLPRSWWHRRVIAATPWPGETIDTTIVTEEERSPVGRASLLER
jgi:hypothetical protein